MADCAVVRSSDNMVINTIIALPTDPAPEGCYLVEMSENSYGGIGWTWDGTYFIAPEEASGGTN